MDPRCRLTSVMLHVGPCVPGERDSERRKRCTVEGMVVQEQPPSFGLTESDSGFLRVCLFGTREKRTRTRGR